MDGLPANRIDVTGEIQEPLTIQWAGALPTLEALLLSKGWRAPPSWTALNALAWLTAKSDAAELPVASRFHSGELPRLTLILQRDALLNSSRFVLRIWAVDMELTDRSPLPVWVGSVVEERLDRPLSLFTIVWTQPDINSLRDRATEGLQSWRLVNRADTPVKGWDGRMLLAQEGSAHK